MNYGVILADPPWKYGQSKGLNGGADNHYSTMATNEICELKVGQIAMDDCVLILWATWPFLQDGFKVAQAWGFNYVTGMPWIKLQKSEKDLWGEWWHKTQVGVGFWVRGVSEPILICRKGKPKLPNGDFVGLLSPNIGHSMKPDNIYEYAESLNGPYLELFARRRRANWDAFGNEVEGSIKL